MSVQKKHAFGSISNAQNIKIKLSSFSSSSIKKASEDLMSALRKIGAITLGPIPIPNAKTEITVPRSPHVFGKARDKMRLVKHSRVIVILQATSSEIDAISSVNIMSGVGVEISIIGTKEEDV